MLDLSRYLPGPLVTRLLADLGARVIKVEPLDGDPMWGKMRQARLPDDQANPDRFQQGNRLAQTRLPDPIRGGRPFVDLGVGVAADAELRGRTE